MCGREFRIPRVIYLLYMNRQVIFTCSFGAPLFLFLDKTVGPASLLVVGDAAWMLLDPVPGRHLH